MNEHLNIYETELGQSSKGFWYCKSLKITHCNDKILVDELDELIEQIEKIIKTYNTEED